MHNQSIVRVGSAVEGLFAEPTFLLCSSHFRFDPLAVSRPNMFVLAAFRSTGVSKLFAALHKLSGISNLSTP